MSLPVPSSTENHGTLEVAPTEPPASRYLRLLAEGHPLTYARTHAGFEYGHEGASIELARQDQEFKALEQLYVSNSLTGARPAMAKALVAHKSLDAVQRLATEMDSAKYSRDRIAASVALLDRGPLAPKQGAQVQAQQLVVNIQVVSASEVRARIQAQTTDPSAQDSENAGA